MAKAPRPKTISVSVDLPQAKFERVMYFNKFAVEAVGAHKLIHFGFETHGRAEIPHWSCLFDAQMVEERKEDWLNYLSEAGYPSGAARDEKWRPTDLTSVPISNVVLWTRSGEEAEVRCYNYSIGDLVAVQRGATPNARKEAEVKVSGQPLALLRCPVELQRQLLDRLYSEML